MVDQRAVRALQSDDPTIRRRAITALGRSMDRDALPHLAQVYRNDPDDELRELARKAGIYIRRNAAEEDPEPATDDAPSPVDIYDAASSYTPPEVQVSAVAEQRAKSAFERAVQANLRGDNEEAREALQKTFSFDPRLTKSEYHRSFTGQVMGLEPEQAIKVLMSGVEQKASSGGGFGMGRSGLILIGIVGLGGLLLLAGLLLT
jgi:HEAT repeat protein